MDALIRFVVLVVVVSVLLWVLRYIGAPFILQQLLIVGSVLYGLVLFVRAVRQ